VHSPRLVPGVSRSTSPQVSFVDRYERSTGYRHETVLGQICLRSTTTPLSYPSGIVSDEVSQRVCECLPHVFVPPKLDQILVSIVQLRLLPLLCAQLTLNLVFPHVNESWWIHHTGLEVVHHSLGLELTSGLRHTLWKRLGADRVATNLDELLCVDPCGLRCRVTIDTDDRRPDTTTWDRGLRQKYLKRLAKIVCWLLGRCTPTSLSTYLCTAEIS